MQFQSQSLLLFVLASAPSAVDSLAIPKPWLDLSNGLFPVRPGGWPSKPRPAAPTVLPTPTNLPLPTPLGPVTGGPGSGLQLETKETLAQIEKREIEGNVYTDDPRKAQSTPTTTLVYTGNPRESQSTSKTALVYTGNPWESQSTATATVNVYTDDPRNAKPTTPLVYTGNPWESQSTSKTALVYTGNPWLAQPTKAPRPGNSSMSMTPEGRFEAAWLRLLQTTCGEPTKMPVVNGTTEAKAKPSTAASASPMPSKRPSKMAPASNAKGKATSPLFSHRLDLSIVQKFFIADGRIASAAETVPEAAMVRVNGTGPVTPKKPKTVNGLTLEQYVEDYIKNVVCKSPLGKRAINLSGNWGMHHGWSSKAIVGAHPQTAKEDVDEAEYSAAVMPTATATPSASRLPLPTAPLVKRPTNSTVSATPRIVRPPSFISLWTQFVNTGCAYRESTGTKTLTKREDSPDSPDTADTPDSPDGTPETPETPESDDTKQAAANSAVMSIQTAPNPTSTATAASSGMPTGAIPTRVLKPTGSSPTTSVVMSTSTRAALPPAPTGTGTAAPVPTVQAPQVGEVIARVVELVCDSRL